MSRSETSLAIIPRDVNEVTDLAERLAKSTLLPKSMQGKAPDVLLTILAGQEMGLAPMASLRAFHVIEGKPVLGAAGMVAVILGSGKAEYFERVDESPTSVTYETKRVGGKGPKRCTWTMEMAKAAALDKKDNWRLYPRAMLASRAQAELAREVYPDVILGCFIEEEIERIPVESIPARAVEVEDAELAPEPVELAGITAAESVEQLKALAPTLEKVADEWKQVARERYQARMKQLRAA